MSYRRSMDAVSEEVGAGLAIPRRRRGARWPRDVNSREDRATIAALPPGSEPAGSPACGSQPTADGKAHVRNPQGTRAAILEAATRIFALRGFVGASMQDITDASGINKSPIYHHFGSKEGLYAAVKQNLAAACDRQSVGIDRADERPADPRAELRRLFETFRDNEALLRVCAWSRLEGGRAGGPGETGLMQALRKRLELAQERRIIRGDIDPGNLTVMLVALVAFWLEGHLNAAVVVEGGPDEPAYLRQAIALVERGLLPNPEFS
jgi:TetR/AcrR family transcriptional regulator